MKLPRNTNLLRHISCAAIAAGSVIATHWAVAQPATLAAEQLPEARQMDRIEAAIDAALVFIADAQKEDGSWPSAQNYNGVNAICVLAFLGRGHEPGRGPYATTVDRGIAHLLSRQREHDGYFGGSMYDHALATLALIEAYGFIGTDELHQRIQKAVDLIIASQSAQGGWRYNPVPADADLSVTVMQVVALHAAQNARFRVPENTLVRARRYVQACATAPGGFSYMPNQSTTAAQSAAGALSLQLLGLHDDPRVPAALGYISKVNFIDSLPYFYYFTYYAMQASFQAGGDQWASWHPKVRDWMLANQQEDGSFVAKAEQNINGPARIYSTAMAAMSLEVYMHYLPAYQR